MPEDGLRVTMVWLDYAILATYFAGVVGSGLYFAKRQKNTEAYFLANHSIPGWVVGFALLGTMIGSSTFVGHSGNVFNDDFWALSQFFALPLVMILVARFLVVFYRRTLRMTAYGYLEKRFGYPARLYGGVAFIVSRIVDVSATLYFLAVAVAYMTGWDIWWVIAVLGSCTLIYTFLGGIEAVVWVSVAQSVLLVLGGLLIFLVALLGPEAGPAKLIETAWEGGKFGLGNWSFDLHTNNIWLYTIGGIVWAVQRYACDQHMVQKYLVAKSDKDAIRGAFIGALACLPVWLMFMFIGALIWSFYQLGESSLPAGITGDSVVPHFITTQFPVGFAGLLLSALAAAAMSSLASDLNSLGTVVVEDVYGRLKAGVTDSQQLFVGKTTVLCFGVASILLAQQWIGIGSFLETMVTLLSIVTGGMLGLFVLGLFTRKATARGAYWGIAACVLFTVWGTFTTDKMPGFEKPVLDLGGLNYPLIPFTIGIFNHVIVVVVGYLSSLALGGPAATSHGLTIWNDPSE